MTPTSLCREPDAPVLRPLRDAVDEVVLNPYGRPMTEAELADVLPGVYGVLAGLDDFGPRALDAADALRVIARYGVGVDNVDLRAAHERGIVVTRAPGANALAVAELTIGLVFAVARGIPSLDAGVRAGEWPRYEGRELTGGVFGTVGLGAIGRLVAERARGIGMSVVAYDPMVGDDAFAHAGVERCDLDELCRRSDVVSLHVPLAPETRHLLDDRRLALLPPRAIVVNTARGGLIDEAAARRALDAGRLFGVALDSYETEPPSESPLIGHPCVVSTPHSGAHTAESVARVAEQSIRDLLVVLGGGTSANAVTPTF